MDKLLIKRGSKRALEQLDPLSVGELFLAKDEERLYIGGPKGNIPIATQKEVDEITAQLAHKMNVTTVENYGAIGDGVNDDSQAFIDAINEGQSNIIVLENGKTYRITRDIYIRKDITIEGNNATILLDDSVGIHVEGEVYELNTAFTTYHDVGSHVLKLTNADDIEQNDLLILTDVNESSFSDYRTYYFDGEFVEVERVENTDIYLKTRIETTYGPTPNFKVYKVKPIKVILNNLNIKKINGHAGDVLYLRQTADSELNNISLENENAHDCLFVLRCYNLTLRKVKVNNKSTNTQDYGYGMVVRASQHINVYDSHFRSRRHATAVGSFSELPSPVTRHIHFYNTTFMSFGNIYNTHAADFHGSVKNGYYHNCTFYGGVVLGGEDVGVYGGTVYANYAQSGLSIREIKGGKVEFRDIKYFSPHDKSILGYHSPIELKNVSKDVDIIVDNITITLRKDVNVESFVDIALDSVNESKLNVQITNLVANKTPSAQLVRIQGTTMLKLKHLVIRDINLPTLPDTWYRVWESSIDEETRITLPPLTLNDSMTFSDNTYKTIVLPVRFQHINPVVEFTINSQSDPGIPVLLTKSSIYSSGDGYYYFFRVHYIDVANAITEPLTINYTITVSNENVKPIFVW